MDGLILAASLVMLHEARNGRTAPSLARWMLAAGVGATVGANVLYGVPYGALGALLSAWPALSFIGPVEMMMALVRRARPAHQPAQDGPGLTHPGTPVPASALEAAGLAYVASVQGGNPLSGRALQRQFGISRAEATKVRQPVLAGTNGVHAPEGDS